MCDKNENNNSTKKSLFCNLQKVAKYKIKNVTVTLKEINQVETIDQAKQYLLSMKRKLKLLCKPQEDFEYHNLYQKR